MCARDRAAPPPLWFGAEVSLGGALSSVIVTTASRTTRIGTGLPVQRVGG
jgi:hypothetical protein